MSPKPAPAAATDDEGEEPPDEPVEESEGSTPDQDLAEIPEDGDSAPVEESTESEGEPDEEIADPFEGEDDVEVDLADTTVGDDPESPFAGDDDVETGGSDDEETAAPDPTTGMDHTSNTMDASDIEESMAALSDDEQLVDIINEGFARLAVVGLEEGSQKDGLETEFAEVFETFRLGHFGSEAMEEYVLTGPEENVDPLWAFTISLALCSAVTVYMRPDGDEIVASAKDSLARFTGGFNSYV